MIDQNGSIFTIMLYNMEIGTKRMFSLAAVNNQGELWHSWHVDVIGMLINLSNCMKCHKLSVVLKEFQCKFNSTYLASLRLQ